MFARLFAIASLAALAVAGNAHLAARDQCSTGGIYCCESTYQSSDVHNVLSKAGINILASLGGVIGGNCSPIGVVGVADQGASCTQKPVCCDNNHFYGGLVVGCSPINLS